MIFEWANKIVSSNLVTRLSMTSGSKLKEKNKYIVVTMKFVKLFYRQSPKLTLG